MQPHSEACTAPLAGALALSWALAWTDGSENADGVAEKLCLCADEFSAIVQGRLSVDDAITDLEKRFYSEARKIIGKMGGRRTLLDIAYVVAAVRFCEAVKLAGLTVKGLYPGWTYDKEGHLAAIDDLTETICNRLPIRSPHIKPLDDSPNHRKWLADYVRRFDIAFHKIGWKLHKMKRQRFTRRSGELRQLTAFEKDLSTLLFRAGAADRIPSSPKAMQKAWRLWRSNPVNL